MYRTGGDQEWSSSGPTASSRLTRPRAYCDGLGFAGVSARSREIPQPMREERIDVPGAKSLSPVPLGGRGQGLDG